MMLLDKLSNSSIMKNKTTSIMALEDSFADKYGNNIYASVGIDRFSIIARIKEIKGE